MKNKSTLKNILIVICIFLIIILVVLLLLLYKMIFFKNTPKKIIKNTTISKEYSIKNIDNLSFDLRNSKVYFYKTDRKKILIKQNGKSNNFLINKSKDKHGLYFRELPTNILIKTTIKIYIPSEYSKSIKIKNGFGNLRLDSFENDIDIENNAGNVVVKKINNLKIKSVSGNINVKSISNSLSVSSSTGDILIDYATGKINIDTIIGDVIINKYLINRDSIIETTSGNINIKIDKNSKCLLDINSENEYNKISKKVCKSKNNYLRIKNVSGEVIVK